MQNAQGQSVRDEVGTILHAPSNMRGVEADDLVAHAKPVTADRAAVSVRFQNFAAKIVVRRFVEKVVDRNKGLSQNGRVQRRRKVPVEKQSGRLPRQIGLRLQQPEYALRETPSHPSCNQRARIKGAPVSGGKSFAAGNFPESVRTQEAERSFRILFLERPAEPIKQTSERAL